MSITFIPISTFKNDMFNENIVTKKWNDFIGNLSVSLSSVCNTNIDIKELETILQYNLDKHYTNIESKKTTPSLSIIDKKEAEEDEYFSYHSPTPVYDYSEDNHIVLGGKLNKSKSTDTEPSVKSKKIETKLTEVKSESAESTEDEPSVKTVKSKKIKPIEPEGELLPVKVSKSKKTKPVEIVTEEVEIKPVIVKKDEIIVKEKCQQILKNNKQCNGNITKNSKFCSRHTE